LTLFPSRSAAPCDSQRQRRWKQSDGKRAIAALPVENLEVRSFGFDPSGSANFQFFHRFGNGFCARQPE
jgi:hypothetical protein